MAMLEIKLKTNLSELREKIEKAVVLIKEIEEFEIKIESE